MLKQLLPLIFLAVSFLAAPAALAECYKCRTHPPDPCPHCVVATIGMTFSVCGDLDCGCDVEFLCVPSAAEAATPALASEFTVASVGPLDDAQPAPARPLVASANLTPSDIH